MNQVSDKSGNFKARITYEIATGVYQTGDRLPSEREFCELYNISRTAIRPALEELTAGGIIERRARSGAFISARALELINCRNQENALSVVFIMPPLHITNPLIQQVFMSFNQYAGSDVKSSVIFEEVLRQDILQNINADVAVVFGNNDRKQLNAIAGKVSTLVLLNAADTEFNHITPDNYAGGRMMAEYVLACGHREISAFCWEQKDERSDFSQRFFGIRDVLAEAGIKPNTENMTPKNYFNIIAPCRQALNRVITVNPRLSAIMCLSDLMAMGVYEALRSRKLSIPDDVSVIGFDEQYFSQYTLPPLTTVKYPSEAVGIKLAGFIADLIKGKTNQIQEQIQPILIKRESVKSKEN